MEKKQDEKDEGNLCEFERERIKRIARNRRVLAELGLSSNAQPHNVDKEKKREKITPAKKIRPSMHVARRSKRLKGLPADSHHDERMETLPRKSVLTINPAKKLRIAQEADSLYHHNLMRLRSMSETALEKRIKKITNIEKLHSFLQVCRDEGRDELAAAVEERLKQSS